MHAEKTKTGPQTLEAASPKRPSSNTFYFSIGLRIVMCGEPIETHASDRPTFNNPLHLRSDTRDGNHRLFDV